MGCVVKGQSSMLCESQNCRFFFRLKFPCGCGLNYFENDFAIDLFCCVCWLMVKVGDKLGSPVKEY